jgi:DNA excision repair protein ERCC-2
VRDFALPIPRMGSIETHSGYGTPNNFGIDVHRRLQQQRSQKYDEYRAEMKFTGLFTTEQYEFTVTGMADGFYEERELIEEIKTAFDIDLLREKLESQPAHPYILQLQTYGYLFYLKHGRQPKMVLLLVSTRDGKERVMPITLETATYESWLKLRLEELCLEARQKEDTEARRKRVADNLRFPFRKMRSGQEQLVARIEESLKQGKHVLVQAATGLGKTIGVTFPMLRHALSRGQRLIYVTPKNSQHMIAEETISNLQQDSELKLLTLTAKSKMCLKREMICNPVHCEFARDYYEKVYKDNLIDIVWSESTQNSSRFKALGEKFTVCPFELSVDSIERADVVVADYNYVFSPRSLIGRLTSSKFGTTRRPNLVIDEAHNLPTRAAGYYSPVLSIALLNSILWQLPMNERALMLGAENVVKQCMKIIDRYRPPGKNKSAKVVIDIDQFEQQLEVISQLLNRYLEGLLDLQHSDPVVSLFNEWSAFTDALYFEGEEFVSIFQGDSAGGALKVVCCDASTKLQEAHKLFDHVAAFSATLKPFEYYQQMIGLAGNSLSAVEFPTPFRQEQRKILVIPQVSTKLADRQANYEKIARGIEKITSFRTGNYILFFPSYSFLEEVASCLSVSGYSILKQEREMDKSAIERYLHQLREMTEPTLLLAVQGGVFAEGIDYPGEMLVGAIIVGPPLPTFDLEREILREYYEKRYGKGFHYAYIYPAMSKVVQAAGRVIRTETDRGLIVLMDKRFILPDYCQSMPVDWFANSVRELVSSQIKRDICDFWQSQGYLNEEPSEHLDPSDPLESVKTAKAGF